MAEGKWITDLTAETPIVEAARRVLAVRLEVVRDALPRALHHAGEDPEHVHQLRVGTRRAGAALRIFRACLPEKARQAARKRLRQLRRAAAEARDWDVFLADLRTRPARPPAGHQPGLDFLVSHAVSHRLLAQDHLQQAAPRDPSALDTLVTRTVDAVRAPEASPGATLLDLARPQLGELLAELEEAAARDLADFAQLHQVRILGKRLRYAMEVFVECFDRAFRDDLYPAVEEMQEILGLANDSHVAATRVAVLCSRLPELWPAEWKRWRPGVRGYLATHRRRLTQQRRRFARWWPRWQQRDAAAFTELLRT